MTTSSKASTEISTETNTATQEDVKTNLPSLPDAFGEESLLNRFKEANKEARAVVPDVKTEQGRKDIKDMAKKVAASNKALDTPMRDYLRILKTQPKALEKNARESKARFDDLKADILKPLLEAQESQDKIINWLLMVPETCSGADINSAVLNKIIDCINGYTVELVWPELKKKFKVAHESALTTATVTLERIEEAEKQAARLAELEAKQAAAEQAESNRKVAEQAAANARAEAEAKAQRDREDVDRRAAESRQREENAKAAEAKAIRDAELAREENAKAAEQYKIDVENERLAAEERQRIAIEQATARETKRIADEEAEHLAQAKARESRKDHRASIHRQALVAMIALGIEEKPAREAILAIRDGKVPNISIQY
tara:strand:- start:768 stop:1892 length:1125 start_codon:yes stop_codon:yes gene_type:complete